MLSNNALLMSLSIENESYKSEFIRSYDRFKVGANWHEMEMRLM
jgi:hypothetical protein